MIDITGANLENLLERFLSYSTKMKGADVAIDYFTKDREMENLKRQYLKTRIMREKAELAPYLNSEDFEDELNDDGEDSALKDFIASRAAKGVEKIPLYEAEPISYTIPQKIFSELKPVFKEATAHGSKLKQFARILSRLK